MSELKIFKLSIKENLEQYLNLICQLKYTQISVIQLREIILNLPINHKIFIAKLDKNIVGTITFILEQKIIHNGKSTLHIEDVVVCKKYRGLGIASKLLDFSKNFAEKNNCYKIILNCNDKLESFYKKNGFENKNIQMAYYFNN